MEYVSAFSSHQASVQFSSGISTLVHLRAQETDLPVYLTIPGGVKWYLVVVFAQHLLEKSNGIVIFAIIPYFES